MESCGNLDIQEQMWLYIILLTLQATFVPNLPFAKFDYVFCTYLCEKRKKCFGYVYLYNISIVYYCTCHVQMKKMDYFNLAAEKSLDVLGIP